MDAVIYARYSSHGQDEQTIESQIEACTSYAEKNGIYLTGKVYADYALTGTNDRRPDLNKMIIDSSRHLFDVVLVWKFERFARNRYDSATLKAKLKKNGVRVISISEPISDNASGILMEGILESFAEYQSASSAENIRRGLRSKAEKFKSLGSNPGLGFKISNDKSIIEDKDTSSIVKQIFEQYASGKTIVEITTELNDKGFKTSRGNEFNKNSLRKLLQNRRYIGSYIFKGEETPNVLPKIVDETLFNEVQRKMEKNRKAPAHSKAKEEYLLTTKLFCGHCKEMLTGYSGTSKTGKVHNYYICNGVKKKSGCKKKTVRKEYIEGIVVSICRKLLNDKNIDLITRVLSGILSGSKPYLIQSN